MVVDHHREGAMQVKMRVAPPLEVLFPAVAFIGGDKQQAAAGKLPKIAQAAESNVGKEQNRILQALLIVTENLVEVRLIIIIGRSGLALIGDFNLLEQVWSG